MPFDPPVPPRASGNLLSLEFPPDPPGELSGSESEAGSLAAPASGASLLRSLVQIDLTEEEAEQAWEEVSEHRAELSRKLGRDIGARVACLDHFLNRKGILKRPGVVEQTCWERTDRASPWDGLTGLAGPRHFQACLRREIRRAQRRSTTLSLVLVDPAGFREVNERLGRNAGDEVVRDLAFLIEARLRSVDLAARLPGPRFALLLPQTRRLGAFVASERIREAILERHRMALGCGVASHPEDADTPEELLDAAERALSAAKGRGGGLTVIHPRERRDAVRFLPVGRSLRARAFLPGGTPPEVLRAKNLSESGACFASPRPLDPGDELDVRFTQQGPEPDLSLPARVTRSLDPKEPDSPQFFEVGVRFLLDSPDTGESLGRFLQSLRRHGIEEGTA